MQSKMEELKIKLEKFNGADNWSVEKLIEFAGNEFSPKLGIASSFSIEDVVLIDLLSKSGKQFKIFSLQTGRLNPETLEVAEQVADKYQKQIDWFYPIAQEVEKLELEKGFFSFKESVEERKHCCFIRKVEPLRRALKTLDAWMTGQRKSQSVTRASLALVEIDQGHDLFKFNPLANWSYQQIQDYVKQNKLPYNKLYDLGYASIGCAPCTRAIKPGEDERAGRWWWESAEHKECGLHLG